MYHSILSVRKSATGSRIIAYKGGFAEIKLNNTATRNDFKYLVKLFPEGRNPSGDIVAKCLAGAYDVVKNH